MDIYAHNIKGWLDRLKSLKLNKKAIILYPLLIAALLFVFLIFKNFYSDEGQILRIGIPGEIYSAGPGMYESREDEVEAIANGTYIPEIIAQGDLTGDGNDDIVVGHAGSPAHWYKGQIYVYSLSEEQPVDITSRFVGLPSEFAAIRAQAVIGDFNGDGLADLAVFEKEGRGGLELSDHTGAQGAFVGASEPILFLQNETGTWEYSSGFGDAVLERRSEWGDERCGTPYESVSRWDPSAGDPPGVGTWVEAPGCDLYEEGDNLVSTLTGKELHIKYVSSGDITGSGFDAVVAETGGGWATVNAPEAKMFVFLWDGTKFYVAGDEVLGGEVVDGPNSDGWRHHAHKLADVDGDGHLDLVLGRLSNVDSPDYVSTLRNKVVINDGQGRLKQVINLPDPVGFFPEDQAQYAYATRVDGIVVEDLNLDGLNDIILMHTRGGSNIEVSPIDDQSGRWLQVLIQSEDGFFEDATSQWLPDQSPNSPGGSTRIELFSDGDYREILVFDSNRSEPNRYVVDARELITKPLSFDLKGSMARINRELWVEVYVED